MRKTRRRSSFACGPPTAGRSGGGDFPSATYQKNASAAYASATPALDQERVYVAWATPKEYIVLALSQKDGSDVWRRDLGPFASQHGFGASPIVWKDLVIVANDQDKASFIAALDCKTGQTRWQAERRTEKASFSTPCLFEPKDGKPQLILSSWSHGLTSLDPQTGKQNWDLPVFHDNRIVGSPMIAAGLIFAAAGVGGGGKEMVAVEPGDPDRGVEAKVAYNVQGSLPYVPTPVAKGRLLFLWHDNGVVACTDAPTGKRLWQQRVGGSFFGSPVRVGIGYIAFPARVRWWSWPLRTSTNCLHAFRWAKRATRLRRSPTG